MVLNCNKSAKRKNRRGKYRRKSSINKPKLSLSILGSNANGINGKLTSFKNAIKQYGNPSCITLQETKLRSNNFKVPGYQVFQKNRTGFGGGLITAIDENIASVLVSNTESEILVVQIKVEGLEIRIINAYGPQEDSSTENIHNFWQDLEKEITLAKEENCKIIIQMDANAKLGCDIIKGDPNKLSNNGSLLLEIVRRQNLSILNINDLCQGLITRHRKTVLGDEKSIIDYILVCDFLLNYVDQMKIDDKRTHVLTKYSRGGKSESDHNLLYAKFAIAYYQMPVKVRREIFNFKNQECQQKFFDVTNNTNKLSSCFEGTQNFSQQSKLFQKTLNGTFHQCFKKIRITNKTKTNKPEDEIQKCLELKTKLQVFANSAKSPLSKQLVESKIGKLEQTILELTSLKNAEVIKEQISHLRTLEGSFSQNGMWKVKSRLCPRKNDPPMAKKDKDGNLITSQEALKKLYINTYVNRLKHREIKTEYQEIFEIKNLLWNERFDVLKRNLSSPWTLKDIEIVSKTLKNNQTRDPNGMINELFKKNVMGQDLKSAVLQLMNGIKVNFEFPEFMQLANISTIYKNKGSRFDLENDRGIFILSVLRKIFDKLIYKEKYPGIDSNMSDSNIGARKGKNIKNHLFVVYGIINSVIEEEKSCVDIQIYDIVKAFDALWLEDCMNDMFDSLPSEQLDDKLALMYEANRNNLMAVNTAVGLTDRVNVSRVVTQGGVFGSLQCSNSIDTLGKKCFNTGEHLFTYKQIVKIMPLSMVDDLLAVAKCGNESFAVNTYINAQIEMKKLRFHTPDKNGKSKCNVIHVGKKNHFCPTLQVHGTVMGRVSEDTYLGDIISQDGKNTKNVNNRVAKGLGIINDIMNILEKVSHGQHYFKMALHLRESLFLNGILTNAEIWYGLSKSEMKQLEDLDLNLLRKIIKTPFSAPPEAIYLELGCLSIPIIIKARRINYLHYLVTQEENSMLYKFFCAQWKYPIKSDWTEQVRLDLAEFGIPVDLDYILDKSKSKFQKIVKIKAKEFAFFSYLQRNLSKLENLFYTELKLQKYLELENMTVPQAQSLFSYRTRMANFSENFRGASGPQVCPLCKTHLDSQNLSFQCPLVKENVKIEGQYYKIFTDNTDTKLVNTLVNVTKFRDEYIQSRKIK